MQIQTSNKFDAQPDVVHTLLEDGGSVLLHLGTQTYYSLNETGSFVWQHLVEKECLGEIGEKLEASYAVTPENAQHSVLNLAAELLVERLIVPVDPACS